MGGASCEKDLVGIESIIVSAFTNKLNKHQKHMYSFVKEVLGFYI